MRGLLDRIIGIDQLDVTSRRVLVRVDFDIPTDSRSPSVIESKVRAVLPTIKHLISKNARIVIASHWGHPKKEKRSKFSLEAFGACLAEHLAMDIVLTDDCVGDGAKKVVRDLRDGHVALLENLQFHPEEDHNDIVFAKDLAKHADIYVNDALAACNHGYASVDALARTVRDRATGFLLGKELEILGKLRAGTERPLVVVLGGNRVQQKLDFIDAILPRIDGLLLGGCVANTFLAAQNINVGKSSYDTDKVALARDLLEKAKQRNVFVGLPSDVMISPSVEGNNYKTTTVGNIGAHDTIVDIGQETTDAYREKLIRARSIFFSGPMGLIEKTQFAAGTNKIALAISESASFSVALGADTAQVVQKSGLSARFAHISTGGQASLDLIEGRILPGVEALRT